MAFLLSHPQDKPGQESTSGKTEGTVDSKASTHIPLGNCPEDAGVRSQTAGAVATSLCCMFRGPIGLEAGGLFFM